MVSYAQGIDALNQSLSELNGIDVSFEFLGAPASYDINQRLLDYTSRDTHLRASLLGVLGNKQKIVPPTQTQAQAQTHKKKLKAKKSSEKAKWEGG